MFTILGGKTVHSETDISVDTEHSSPFTAHTIFCYVLSTETVQFNDTPHTLLHDVCKDVLEVLYSSI